MKAQLADLEKYVSYENLDNRLIYTKSDRKNITYFRLLKFYSLSRKSHHDPAMDVVIGFGNNTCKVMLKLLSYFL